MSTSFWNLISFEVTFPTARQSCFTAAMMMEGSDLQAVPENFSAFQCCNTPAMTISLSSRNLDGTYSKACPFCLTAANMTSRPASGSSRSSAATNSTHVPVCCTAARATSRSARSSEDANSSASPYCETAPKTTSRSPRSASDAYSRALPNFRTIPSTTVRSPRTSSGWCRSQSLSSPVSSDTLCIWSHRSLMDSLPYCSL
mmetsp:Transcript_92826/g.199084  ORF Transcript_92826/g.199084 Transcript_92826/m.199084 type:complete len:201 (+) Transcript_92826:669-1271(+)